MTGFQIRRVSSVTLETPEEFAQWLAVGLAADAARQAKKDARKGKQPTV